MRVIVIVILFFSLQSVVYAKIDFVKYKLKYKQSELKKTDKNIAKTLRKHFKQGEGSEFKFSYELINDLASVIVRRNLLSNKKLQYLRTEGNVHWYSMPTYPTKYSTVVGRIDIAFETNEKDKTFRIVGVEDIYDFNPKKKGGRPWMFEIITRVLHKTIYKRKGTPFRMYYRAKEM